MERIHLFGGRGSRRQRMQNEDEGIVFRRATDGNRTQVRALFEEVWAELKREGVVGKGEAGPSAEMIDYAIAVGQLFVGFYEERLVAAYVLRRENGEERCAGLWQYPQADYGVVRWLCVKPAYQGIQMGRRTMRHVEKQGRQLGMETLRVEVSVFNRRAVALCQHLHYQKVGVASRKTGQVYCMEKKI